MRGGGAGDAGDGDVDAGGPAAGERPLEGGPQLFGPLDVLPVGPERHGDQRVEPAGSGASPSARGLDELAEDGRGIADEPEVDRTVGADLGALGGGLDYPTASSPVNTSSASSLQS